MPVTFRTPQAQEPVPLDSFDYAHAPGSQPVLSETKYADESAVDDSMMMGADGRRSGSPSYTQLESGQRRGIWMPVDFRAFQQQSLPMKILRSVLFFFTFGIILTLCILILLFLFLRPPNIGIQNVSAEPQNLSLSSNSFSFDANISVVISNPNAVSAKIKNVTAVAYDAAQQSTSVGSCQKLNQEIVANSNTTVVLPCVITYDLTKDPNLAIIKDIANRCFNTKQNLQLLLKVHLLVQLFSFSVPINVSPTVSMKCPVSKDQVQQIIGNKDLGDLGINLLAQRRRHDEDALLPRARTLLHDDAL